MTVSLPTIGFGLGITLVIYALTKTAADKTKNKAGAVKGELPDQVKLYRRNVLLTEPEQVLFHRIKAAVPGHLVFAQVALNQLVGVDRSVEDSSLRTRAQFKINPKSVDFVVCAQDGAALAAIELDDASHARADRQQADKDKERALVDAGIPLHRFSTKAIPDEAQLKAVLLTQAA